MDERLKTNLAKWNALVPVHARSKMYDVAGFKAGRISLHELELAEVGARCAIQTNVGFLFSLAIETVIGPRPSRRVASTFAEWRAM